MSTRRISEFLDGSDVRYVTIIHSASHTAQETAASTHIPGKLMAKTVIVNLDGRIAMAVVPASREVNLEALRQQSGALNATLADEADFIDRFAGCQLGTAPPFGNLFGVDTFMDRDLSRRDEIAFTAGTHTHVIAMTTADYLRLVKPVVVRIAAVPIGQRSRAVKV